MRINLHCHSIHSDGTLTIENLVSFIKENKIDYFSLTDHDVISGYKELEKYDLTGTTLINGVEMTCFYDRYFFHILGLNINLDKFQTYITKWRNKYNKRFNFAFKKIYKNLEDEMIDELLSDPFANRVKIRNRLIELEQFKKTSIPYYLQYLGYELNLHDAFEAIKSCGGKIVWAHPFRVNNLNNVEIIFSKNKVDKFMTRFSQLGLNGVEAYYYNFTDEEKEFLLGQAKKHDLIISAGTDFHGKPGKPKTNVAFYELDDELVEDIVSKIKE